MEQAQEYARFGRHIGYVVAANVSILLLGLIQIPILTRELGTALYGTLSLINVTLLLIVPFALLGFGESIVRFLSTEKDAHKTRDDILSACAIVFFSSAAFSMLLFLIADFLAVSVFKDADSSSYIQLASVLVLVNSLLLLPLAYLRMQRRMGTFSLLNLCYHAGQVGLVIVFVILNRGLTGVVTALIISAIVFDIIGLSIVIKQVGFRMPRFTNMKPYLKWGIPLTPNVALLWIIHTSDRYMVSYFEGVAQAGIYSAAYIMGNYASFALVPLGMVLFPNVTRTYDRGDTQETKNYLRYSVRYFMMIAIPCAFGLSILATPLLRGLTTADFVPGHTVVPFVAFGVVMFGLYQIPIYIVQLVNKTHLVLWLLGISAALNIALNTVLIPRRGIEGAALATLITYLVLAALTLGITRKYLRFDLSVTFIVKATISSGVMMLFVWLMSPDSLPWVVFSILVGAISYFAVLLLIGGLSRNEAVFFWVFIKDVLRRPFQRSG